MAGPSNWISQIFSVTEFGLLSIPARRGSVAAAVFGIAGVVTVLVGVLSIEAGFRRVMESSASPESAIVLRAGSENELSSGLKREDARLIAEAPQIATSADGPLSSAELFVIIDLPKRSTGTSANVPLRGVETAAFGVRDNLKIVQGRKFEWGKNEIIVGIGAAQEFTGLQVGKTIRVGQNEWAVVGLFSADGASADSELWTDAKVLQGAYKRGDSFQSVSVRLTSADAFQAFKDSLTANPQLKVKVLPLAEYYADQSRVMTTMIKTVGYIVAVLMAIGAIFGALNTMYNSVSARTREIATLRALGFGRGAVIISVMLESVALALMGGVLGAAIAYFVFNGFHTTTMNFQTFSQVTFAFAVTVPLLASGIVWATVIGLIGGLFPAIRAARLPIAVALRDL